ncbi:hypothetical protein HNR44_001411 [Geomicrobium halophilum]|uniref:Uncharacterized protein n=1 Tax=Geomicrobium halophilum TaxID=549000 RepID=A0A841PYL3_9BACL|nr:hypothetical protein [Geomicrobium halophilum]MBB6449462.1 hypothetical protein [Geomicrobium halophilum]
MMMTMTTMMIEIAGEVGEGSAAETTTIVDVPIVVAVVAVEMMMTIVKGLNVISIRLLIDEWKYGRVSPVLF